MSLLSIVRDACEELSIVQPSAVTSSTDAQVLQLYAFASKEGKELARRFDWEILQKEGAFTSTANETQIAVITTTFSDFGRIVDGSMWDRTENRQIWGPLTPEQWQRRKAAAAQVGVRYYWRIRGGALLFNPLPPSGNSIYFEYVSNKWCQSSGGTAQSDWAADTDTALISEEIIRLGVIWRFRKSKGLDYSEDFRTYEMALLDQFGPEAGNQIVNMTNEPSAWDINIPEGSWSL